MKKKLIQIFVLLSFLSLISLFVLYSTGKLEQWLEQPVANLQGSPNGGKLGNSTDTGKQMLVDSPKVKHPDSAKKQSAELRKRMMSSSKSIITIDNLSNRSAEDSLRKRDSILASARLMFSSKSGAIIPKLPSKLFKTDSAALKKLPTKFPKKKKH
jgi:hypothetical protein